MPLTVKFVKNTKHAGAPAGEKYRDGGGMYLLINAGGKYWRMDYRFAEKHKTLALGTYPAVSLLKVRQRREKARELPEDGIDPSASKKEEKTAKLAALANTFLICQLVIWTVLSSRCDSVGFFDQPQG